MNLLCFDNLSDLSCSEKGFSLLLPSSDDAHFLPNSVRHGAHNLAPVTKASHRVRTEARVEEHQFPAEKREVYLSLLWEHRAAFGIQDQVTSQIIAFRR